MPTTVLPAPGAPFAVTLAPDLRVRDYQREAAQAFYQSGSDTGGSGVVVLAPGAGKTWSAWSP